MITFKETLQRTRDWCHEMRIKWYNRIHDPVRNPFLTKAREAKGALLLWKPPVNAESDASLTGFEFDDDAWERGYLISSNTEEEHETTVRDFDNDSIDTLTETGATADSAEESDDTETATLVTLSQSGEASEKSEKEDSSTIQGTLSKRQHRFHHLLNHVRLHRSIETGDHTQVSSTVQEDREEVKQFPKRKLMSFSRMNRKRKMETSPTEKGEDKKSKRHWRSLNRHISFKSKVNRQNKEDNSNFGLVQPEKEGEEVRSLNCVSVTEFDHSKRSENDGGVNTADAQEENPNRGAENTSNMAYTPNLGQRTTIEDSLSTEEDKRSEEWIDVETALKEHEVSTLVETGTFEDPVSALVVDDTDEVAGMIPKKLKSCLVNNEETSEADHTPSIQKKNVVFTENDPDVKSISIYSYLYDVEEVENEDATDEESEDDMDNADNCEDTEETAAIQFYHSRPHNDQTRAEAFKSFREENAAYKQHMIEKHTPHYSPESKEYGLSRMMCYHHYPMPMSERRDPGFEYLEKIFPVTPWICHKEEIQKYGACVDVRTATKFYEGGPISVLERQALQNKVNDAINGLFDYELKRSDVPLERLFRQQNGTDLDDLIYEYGFLTHAIGVRIDNSANLISMLESGMDFEEAEKMEFDPATRELLYRTKGQIEGEQTVEKGRYYIRLPNFEETQEAKDSDCPEIASDGDNNSETGTCNTLATTKRDEFADDIKKEATCWW